MAEKTFDDEAAWFVSQVGSIGRMLPIYATISSELTKRYRDEARAISDAHGIDKVFSPEGELLEWKLGREHQRKYASARRKRNDAAIFTRMLPQMAIVSLVSVFDAYLARLIRLMFEARPEILDASSRQLTFAELKSFASIEDAREHVAQLEIESILRESHTEHFNWLEAKLGIPLRKDLAVWPTFIEVTERRNLFVHADGIVSEQYLSVCKKAGVPMESTCKLGSELHVPPLYFRTAYRCIAEIGIKLNQVMWRKLIPAEIARADKSLIGLSYDLLTVREFAIVESVLSFGTQPQLKHASSESLMYLKMNLAIALKAQSKEDDCNRLLDAIDFSALSDLFKLAAASLRGEFGAAADLMRFIGRGGKPSKEDYLEWPLFRWFRKSEQFAAAFTEVFGEPPSTAHAVSAGPDSQSVAAPSSTDTDLSQEVAQSSATAASAAASEKVVAFPTKGD